MRKLYETGFAAGLAAAEDKKFNGRDFRNVGPVAPHDMALSDREAEFIDSIAARTVWRAPTEKQEKWLKSIFLKLGGRL
jgi:hypothetical protein